MDFFGDVIFFVKKIQIFFYIVVNSLEYLIVINQNGSLINLKYVNDGKLQYLGLCDIGESFSYNSVFGFEFKCCIKFFVDDFEVCDLSSFIVFIDFGLD